MSSLTRLLIAPIVGLALTGLLVAAAAAGPLGQAYPSPLTSTPTLSPTAAAPTATPTPASAPTPVPPFSPVVAGGRGRVANLRPNGFTVVWTSDAETQGSVVYGPSTSLGSSAADARGASFAGVTHYVDIGGLAPATIYFFDIVTGGAADANVGQHYSIRTAPELATGPPSMNALVGLVLNPGGGSPAAGAVLWAVVRDGNSQGTTGNSQILAALVGADGRFSLPLQARVPDLASYFIYQNEGDAVDASARASAGTVEQSFNTSITQGGTAPSEARLILTATAGSAAPTATVTAAAPAASATVAPATASPTPAVAIAPTVAAVPLAPTPTRAAAPAQLPPLKEMLLAGLGLQTLPQAPTPAPAGVTAPPPASAPAPPPASAPVPPPAGVGPPAGGPAYPGPQAAPQTASGAPVGSILPGAVPPLQVAPPQVESGPPAAGATGGAVPPAGSLAPNTAAGQPVPGATSDGALPGNPVRVDRPGAAPSGPFGSGTVGTAQPSGGLAAMPAQVTGLFYGGIALALLGGVLAIYAVMSGGGWRPR